MVVDGALLPHFFSKLVLLEMKDKKSVPLWRYLFLCFCVCLPHAAAVKWKAVWERRAYVSAQIAFRQDQHTV